MDKDPYLLTFGLNVLKSLCQVFRVYNVSTTDLTASIKFGIVLYWNDDRFAGKPNTLLPKTLWGPDVHILNTQSSVNKDYEQFAILDEKTGRLKRIINFEATVAFPMKLKSYPFDCQTFTVDLSSISHWSLRDRSDHGSLPKGRTYSLAPVSLPGEGDFMTFFWPGEIPEWRLNGYSVEALAIENKAAGFEMTKIKLNFSVERKATPYMVTIMIPLFVLSISSYALQFIPIDGTEALSARITGSFTLFIAAFGLLFVTTADTPKVSFVTNIDVCILLTLSNLFWVTLEAFITFKLWERNGRSPRGGLLDGGAQAWDYLFFIVAPILLVLWNIFFFVGPYRNQKLAVAAEVERLSERGVKTSANANFNISGIIGNAAKDSEALREMLNAGDGRRKSTTAVSPAARLRSLSTVATSFISASSNKTKHTKDERALKPAVVELIEKKDKPDGTTL